VDAEITAGFRSLVELLRVDRSTLFQWSPDGRDRAEREFRGFGMPISRKSGAAATSPV